jgi:hypothetical protein
MIWGTNEAGIPIRAPMAAALSWRSPASASASMARTA